jgi:hypothetical protein
MRPLLLLALLAIAASPPSEAKQKKPGSKSVTCECKCGSDEQLSGTPGIPRYSTQVTFSQPTSASDLSLNCHSNNGGGCRVQKPDGSYAVGTLSRCGEKTDAAAMKPGDAAPPTPDGGPADSTQPFRPGTPLLSQ